MVQCNRCHLQYTGETKRRLKDRFNEHRRLVDKTNTKSKPTTVSEHFRLLLRVEEHRTRHHNGMSRKQNYSQ